jgi:hypothetical protein
VQINLIFNDNVYSAYPAISKSPKQLPNCVKITKTSVVVEHFQNEGEEEVVVNQGKSWSKDEESVH